MSGPEVLNNPAGVRRKKGLNQAEFWGLIGISQSGGSRYERYNRTIPEPIAKLLLIAHGTSHQSRKMVQLLTQQNEDQL